MENASALPFILYKIDNMPFLYDFSVIDEKDIHTVSVSPKGWVSPIVIEYTVAQAHQYDTKVSVIWRIKGTTHCFTIPETLLNNISHGDYSSHFKEALENFRTDYVSWFTDEMYKECEWKYEYAEQYRRFVLPDSDNTRKN